MEKELLIKFWEVSDYISSEFKLQRMKSEDGEDNKKHGEKKEKCNHNHKDKDEKHNHHKHHHKREKLSLTAKNILRVLIEENSMNQRTLAKKLNVTAQAVSENIKKLETLGFIEKVNNKINNENIISLTPKGVEKTKTFDKIIETLTANIFSKLTKEEKETFFKLLEKINREEG